MEVGDVVRAVYSFQTDLEGELSLQVGDIILVTKMIDKQWLRGISAGKEGNFPSSFVIKIKTPHLDPHEKLFAVTDNFTAQEDGDLSFTRGDVIIGKRAVDNNWWTGECSGKVGIFPLTHVWEIDISRLKKEESPKQVNLKARVKMDVVAQLSNEVDLRKGEIVTVSELTDKDWYTGISGGKRGIFPAAFVTIIDDDAVEDTLPATDSSQELSQGGSPSVKINGLEPTSDDNISVDSDNQFGYDNTNSGITPYGRTRSSFVAQYPNELTFGHGEIITLIRYIDDEWMEGEIDGKIGLFPSSYIDIIVDCADSKKTKLQSKNSQLKSTDEFDFPPGTCGRVLYDFEPQVQGDLPLKEGEIITLLRSLNSTWFEAMANNGSIGLCPANFIYMLDSNLPPLSQPDTPSFQSGNLSFNMADWSNLTKTTSKPERPPPPYSAIVNSETSFHGRSHSDPNSLDSSMIRNIENRSSNASPATNTTGAATLPRSTYSGSPNAKKRCSSLSIDERTPTQEISSSELLSYEEALSQSQPVSQTNNYATAQERSHSYMGRNNEFVETSLNRHSAKTSAISQAFSTVTQSSPRIPHRPAPRLPASRRSSSGSSIRKHDDSTRSSFTPDIQQQLSEKQNELQKLERCKKKLLLEKGYDSSCDEEMAILQSEIKELEEKLHKSLSRTASGTNDDDEARLKREEIVEKKQKEESERREAERRKKMREQRQCVILELLQTERDYLNNLQICQDTFLADPEKGKAKGVEMGMLFGNFDEVIDMASRLLKRLEEAKQESNPDYQLIGDCFIELADDLKEVYGHYCRNHDDIHSLLDKYERDPISAQYLKEGVDMMRQQTNCFDLRSVLIKPVQRILKYPLLLNELEKCTEDTHLDKKKLVTAIGLMTDVATQINEFKRKKDLVFKYRKDADTSLSTRISKLNLHSVMKKSSRIGVKLSTTIGITPMIKDEAFESAEREFRNLSKTIKVFLKDVNTFVDYMQEYAMTALHVAEDIADFYQERKTQEEVDHLRTAHRTVITQFWEEFRLTTEKHVMDPLKQLLQMFNGPNNLIQKRYDKLLDYEACTSRLDRNKDATKQKALQDEQQLSKNTYEALNSQLLDDLPQLSKLSAEILNDCVVAFLQARKKFLGHTARQMIDLMELPLLMGNRTKFLETFQVKHNMALARLSEFSSAIRHLFLSNSSSLKSDTVGKKTLPSSHRLSLGASELNTQQTASQRTFLKSKYPTTVLYDVVNTYIPVDILDICVQKGDLVSVVKKQDPMGSSHRWFVDNGIVRGFVPAKYLKPATLYNAGSSEAVPERRHSMPASKQTLLSQCTKLNDSTTNFQPKEKENSASPSKQAQLCDTSFKNEQYKNLIDMSNGNHQYSNVPVDEFDPFAPLNYSAVDNDTSEDLYATHRYETIPEDNPLMVSQPDASSTVVNEQINEYYYAAYPFTSMGSHQLSVCKGQVVLVHYKNDRHGNSEWWYVEDRHGNQGYVPGNYLVKYSGS